MKVKIVKQENVLGGKPVIEGTRISVDLVMSYFNNDLTLGDIRKAYPTLTDEQIKAAVEYSDDKIRQIRQDFDERSC